MTASPRTVVAICAAGLALALVATAALTRRLAR